MPSFQNSKFMLSLLDKAWLCSVFWLVGYTLWTQWLILIVVDVAGNPLSEDMLMGGSDLEEDNQASVEHVKNLIEDCKKLLISDSTLALGAWGLIDADPQSVTHYATTCLSDLKQIYI